MQYHYSFYDIVQANIKAADSTGISGAFNIASGKNITINNLVKIITKGESSARIEYGRERAGDVRHSLADLSLAHKKINYHPSVDIERGIEEYVKWARKIMQIN